MESRSERFRRLMEPVHERCGAFARGLIRSRSDGNDDYHGGYVPAFEYTRTLVTAIGALALFVAVASSSLRRSPNE